jgi:hypothetical protein
MMRRGMGIVHVVLATVLAMAAVVSPVGALPVEGIQPLSKIAIHKATVNLHGSAYVRAMPVLLGEQVHIVTKLIKWMVHPTTRANFLKILIMEHFFYNIMKIRHQGLVLVCQKKIIVVGWSN